MTPKRAQELYSHDGEMELLLDQFEQRFVRNSGLDRHVFRTDLVIAACDRLGLLVGSAEIADLLARVSRLHGDFGTEEEYRMADTELAAARGRILQQLRAVDEVPTRQ